MISEKFEILKETSKCTETMIASTNGTFWSNSDKVKAIQENIAQSKTQLET